MEILNSVTESLILLGAAWVISQALADKSVHQEELIPIPVKEDQESSRSGHR